MTTSIDQGGIDVNALNSAADAATAPVNSGYTAGEQSALAAMSLDREQLGSEQATLEKEISPILAELKRQQKSLGETEAAGEGVAADRAAAMTQPFTGQAPKADPNLLGGLAPLLLISAFGGRAMGLNATSMLGATSGMVKGYLEGREDLYQQGLQQYQQAYQQFKDRKAEIDKMYSVMQDAYKGRMDYQQKALDMTLKTLDETNNKRRMTLEDKTRLDEAWARIEEQHQARVSTDYFRQQMADMKMKQMSGQLGDMAKNPEAMKTLATQIAHYEIQMPPLGGMAMKDANARTWYTTLDGMVKQINPTFNNQLYGVSAAARRDFTSGKDGPKVQSFNVLVNHLDTLQKMATALDNTDYPTFNALKNTLEGQAGKPAVAEYPAGQQIIADEIVKAVTGGAAALTDRTEANKTVSMNLGPGAINGVIDKYKDLAGGQLDGFRRRYEAAVMAPTFAQDMGLSPAAKALLDRVQQQNDQVQKPQRTVVKTGTLNGRKVVQYSDGSTEYAH